MKKIFRYLRSDRGIAVISALFGVAGFIAAIYFGAVYKERPRLRFEIESNDPVFDVKEEVSNVDFLYLGKSIKKSGQELRIILIKVSNHGNAPIRKMDYDETDPVGIIVTNGEVVEKPVVLETSSENLSSHLQLNLDIPKKIFFSNVIIEPNDFFRVKLLVLHNKDSIPVIQVAGKIAGIKTFELSETVDESKTDSSFSFRESLWNIVSKLSIVVIILVIVTYSLVFIGSIVENKKKIKRIVSVEEFKKRLNDELPPFGEIILDAYIERGDTIFDLLKFPLSVARLVTMKVLEPELYHGLRRAGMFKLNVPSPKVKIDERTESLIEHFRKFAKNPEERTQE